MKGLKISVTPGSRAEKAGIKTGDRILMFNGIPISNLVDYIKGKMMSPSKEFVIISRKGKEHFIRMERI
jgi:S1-C subfamily serine protease